jgi:hypothetical protein
MLTANRDRRFILSLDLHEDHEAEGFYCYEPLTQPGGYLAPAILEAITQAGFPLQTFVSGYDLGYPPEAAAHPSLAPGYVRYDSLLEAAEKHGRPYSVQMFRKAARRVMTFESPCLLRWEDRIAIHRTAVVTAIGNLIV